MAIAVHKGQTALKNDIDAALSALQPEIRQLMQKYGFPVGVPLSLEKAAAHRREGLMTAALADQDPVDVRRHLRRVNDEPVGQRAEIVDVERVRAMFNSRCAHCHSQNGASPQPERDLRRLSRRYGDNWRDVARTTIFEGRSGYGMPNWGETLSRQEIENVLVFLETIQKKP